MGKQTGVETEYTQAMNLVREQTAAMNLVREQTAALTACRSALAACQAENEMLIAGYRFYADHKNWNKQGVFSEMDRDLGCRAREILKGVTGD